MVKWDTAVIFRIGWLVWATNVWVRNCLGAVEDRLLLYCRPGCITLNLEKRRAPVRTELLRAHFTDNANGQYGHRVFWRDGNIRWGLKVYLGENTEKSIKAGWQHQGRTKLTSTPPDDWHKQNEVVCTWYMHLLFITDGQLEHVKVINGGACKETNACIVQDRRRRSSGGRASRYEIHVGGGSPKSK